MSADNELYRALGNIEGKLDTLISSYASTDRRLDASDKRLGAVEKRVWWASGASAAVTMFLTQFLGKPH